MLIPLRPDRRMADQPQNDDESSNLDNAGIVAEISTENDVTATLHDGPDGAPHSAPVVALELPHAANARRSSTIFHRKDASSINAAAAAASTVAGAEAGANLEREIFRDELAQFVADNAHLEHTAEVAEKARLAAVAETSTLRSELEAVRLEFEDLRRTRELQNAPAPGTDVSARALDVPAAPDAASAPTPDQVEILRLWALFTDSTTF
jgi:hypothetical protein